MKEIIATDTFLKGLENKRAALTTMDKDPPDLETAFQSVKAQQSEVDFRNEEARGEKSAF